MRRDELEEILRNGENSGVEFKRDGIHSDQLAKEISALSNLEGGYILLGVEDDGSVMGLTREKEKVEEWVMEVGRSHIKPAIIPYWETMEWDEGKILGIIILPPDCPDKPYKAKKGSAWITMVRVGSTSREATREEEARLYQAAGLIRQDLMPVPGSSLSDLDLRRLKSYFLGIRKQSAPPLENENENEWERLLANTEIMVEERGRAIPTVGGFLLFGRNPNHFLPQAGITAVAYPGLEKDYAALERNILRGPISPLLSDKGEYLETGLIERAIDFVRRNTRIEAWVDENGRRQERWEYPIEVVREAIVNSIAHRDYTIRVTDIELSIYQNRMEIISPGRLPNTATVEKIKQGYRATRNELIKDVLRDYKYIEASGLGIPRKIIKGMLEHNGIEPDFVEEEDRFIVKLWNGK